MKVKLLEIFDIAYKMSSISRYSQTHLVNRESVLEHTGFVALASYIIASKLLEEGEEIDLGTVVCRAVCHDIDEIITGDIPRPTKYYNEGILGIMKEIEDENMDKISNSLGIHMIYSHWKTAKRNDKEGLIVSLCDSLAVMYKSYYEVVMFGNKTIIDHISSIPNHLTKMENNSIILFENSSILLSIIDDAKMVCNNIQTGEYK